MKNGLTGGNRGKVRGRREIQVSSPAEGIKRSIGAKVDVQLWRRLRALAIKQGRRSGGLLDEAIDGYLGKHGG
jgi:hypothetical protein